MDAYYFFNVITSEDVLVSSDFVIRYNQESKKLSIEHSERELEKIVVNLVINGKTLSERIDIGLVPVVQIDDDYLKEFRSWVKQKNEHKVYEQAAKILKIALEDIETDYSSHNYTEEEDEEDED